MPAERLSIQKRRSFNAGFDFTEKERRNQGICGIHERTRFLRWLNHPYYPGEKLHPVRLDSHGQPHYFCRGEFCCSDYCMYHLTHQCEFDQRCKSQGFKRNERGIPYRPDRPQPPPPEDPEATNLDLIASAPPPPPSPDSPSLEEGWRVHGEIG